MITNQKMKMLIKKAKESKKNEILQLEMNDLAMFFSPNLKQVYDCIIISNKKEEELELGFIDAIKMHTDRTGYEASNTETPISLCFENGISEETAIIIGLMVIDVWSIKIKQLDKDSKYCFILASCDGDVEVRFHKVRNNEKSWLTSDLESYNNPVGFEIR